MKLARIAWFLGLASAGFFVAGIWTSQSNTSDQCLLTAVVAAGAAFVVFIMADWRDFS